MKKVIITGPVLSRSGYGEMARFAIRSLLREQVDLYVLSTSWGNTGNLFHNTEEKKQIDSLIAKTQRYFQETNQKPNFDLSIQVTIPNEWKKLALFNIGYTAGIETNAIAPAWLEPSMQMDKIIVISEHAKSSFINTVFGDNAGNTYKVTKPVLVCHFPVRDFSDVELPIDFKDDFNFLTICQWSPRKNLEQTIIGFIEEFKDDSVGLILKINTANDSLIDKEMTEGRLKALLSRYPNRKCSVYLLHGHMTENEMQSLYKHPKVKALVSTTHGEGFGFPMFEAAYHQLPVVATDWSGHLDFLTMKDEDGAEKKMFAKVDFELKPVAPEHCWQGVIEQGSNWAYPNTSNFKIKMREVYKDYGRFKSWAKKLNTWVRSEFTDEKMYAKFSDFCLNNTIASNTISL